MRVLRLPSVIGRTHATHHAGNPPSFSCYRDKGHRTEGIVTYTGCQVITDYMDARSGVFTVKRAGVYRQVCKNAMP